MEVLLTEGNLGVSLNVIKWKLPLSYRILHVEDIENMRMVIFFRKLQFTLPSTYRL